MQRGQSPEESLSLASISERNRRILSHNLALYVAGRENTDTIETIPSLQTLFGSVLHAIGESINSESSAPSGKFARRFHYTSKADADDRLGSKHPTVKPVDLMACLCRLVTPPKGTVLDPFAGSGTTGMACMREGFDCILIEREQDYIKDIESRLAHVSGLDTPLFSQPKDLFTKAERG